MSQVDIFPLDELENSGILQEVNRNFFHPIGLALAITEPDTDLDLINFTGKTESGVEVSGNVFWPKGETFNFPGLTDLKVTTLPCILGPILSSGDDPEGFSFEEGTLDQSKAFNVRKIRDRKSGPRTLLFGSTIQGIPRK